MIGISQQQLSKWQSTMEKLDERLSKSDEIEKEAIEVGAWLEPKMDEKGNPMCDAQGNQIYTAKDNRLNLQQLSIIGEVTSTFKKGKAKTGSFFICEVDEGFFGSKYICISCLHNFYREKKKQIDCWASGIEMSFGKKINGAWTIKFQLNFWSDVLTCPGDPSDPEDKPISADSFKDLVILKIPEFDKSGKVKVMPEIEAFMKK